MLKKNETMGMLWLKANDPQYVSPAKKAAKTRKTEFDFKAYEQTITGYTTAKVNGKWVSVPVGVGFCCGGDGEGRIEPSYAATQEDEVNEKELLADRPAKYNTHGNRTAADKSRAKKERARAKKRNQRK